MRSERFFTYVEKHPVARVVAWLLDYFLPIYFLFMLYVASNFSGEMRDTGMFIASVLVIVSWLFPWNLFRRRLIPDVYKGELVTDYFSVFYHAQSNWRTCNVEVKVNGKSIMREPVLESNQNFLEKMLCLVSEVEYKFRLPDGNCIVLELFDKNNLGRMQIKLDTTIIVKDGKIRYDFIDQFYEGTNNQSGTAQPVQKPINATSSQFPVNESIGRTAPITGLQSGNSYTLTALEGQFAGKNLNLDKAVMLGGDGNCCQITFSADTAGVSRVHCEVGCKEGSLYIRDLGSSYGTVLENGSIVNNYQEVKVENNTVFRLNNNEKFMLTK